MRHALTADPAYARKLVIRAALAWLAARVPVSLAVGAEGLSVFTMIAVVLVATAIAHLDARVMREHIFHGNLGVPAYAPAAVAAAFAGALELGIAVIA